MPLAVRNKKTLAVQGDNSHFIPFSPLLLSLPVALHPVGPASVPVASVGLASLPVLRTPNCRSYGGDRTKTGESGGMDGKKRKTSIWILVPTVLLVAGMIGWLTSRKRQPVSPVVTPFRTVLPEKHPPASRLTN